MESLVVQLRFQAKAGSDLYAFLLERAADNVEAGGVLADVLAPFADDALATAPVLRFMAAVHRLVLEGRAPELAAHYPSAGGLPRLPEVAAAFLTTVEAHADELVRLTGRQLQTNEVGRSAALMPGFLAAAHATGLPLACLEIGASAGLNLRWDRYLYRPNGTIWGDPTSPLDLGDPFEGEVPLYPATVVERAGCDLHPIDPTSEDGRLTLVSCLWPDQTLRFERLRAAIAVARAVPTPVTEETAASWLRRHLAQPRPGITTVVFHSIMQQYVDGAEWQQIEEDLTQAGRRATADAPFAWLRMEPAGAVAETRLTLWPGGMDRVIATSGYHGQNVVMAA